MLAALREETLAANLALPDYGLTRLTWGNVSGIDRSAGLVAIKASGVAYEGMTSNDIVIVDLEGSIVWGDRRPSTDTPSHLALYRAFEEVGGVAHAHSTWATAWAQAGREIPLLGTTHADLCADPIPITRALSAEEVADDYEGATGTALAESIGARNALEVPCVLVRGHAPFCWGETPAKAVENMVTLEEVAKVAHLTTMLEPNPPLLDPPVREKHYLRKHGPQAYYGQS
ncbi:MAG: L-ribulose-5-phosphate 4-epimerase AraD [Solirubrobacterales bacterium]|nr:L-ribulose-5-phosphate 4-epimerase AraD [Solirubrobacterales bacterium]MBV9049001.1 L-ribulose-5-phosphate 4-epimerase AraD [Solirubrobacterales bacterium]